MVLKLFKIAFPLIAFVFLGKLVVENWPAVTAANWQINSPLLALSLFILVTIFFLDGCGWWLILKASGEQLSVIDALAIWLRSSLTRYIPGVVWAYASRIVLSEEHGVTRRNCIISIVVETAMLALGSFTIGLPVLLGLLDVSLFPSVLLGLICIAAILFGLSGVGFSVLSRLPLIGAHVRDSDFSRCQWRWRIYFFYSIFWLCFSLVFLLFLASINVQFDSLDTMLAAGSAFSASFCIGLVLIVFPGGLGIREVTLYGLLSTLVSPPVAIAVSVSSRLWLIAGELGSLLTYLCAVFLRGSRRWK